MNNAPRDNRLTPDNLGFVVQCRLELSQHSCFKRLQIFLFHGSDKPLEES